MAQFVINTTINKNDTAKVTIKDINNAKFADWMIACEYFLLTTAKKSNAGLEKALDLLREGALSFRDK